MSSAQRLKVAAYLQLRVKVPLTPLRNEWRLRVNRAPDSTRSLSVITGKSDDSVPPVSWAFCIPPPLLLSMGEPCLTRDEPLPITGVPLCQARIEQHPMNSANVAERGGHCLQLCTTIHGPNARPHAHAARESLKKVPSYPRALRGRRAGGGRPYLRESNNFAFWSGR